ncbi:response regulator [Nitriliruptor alkaliphilus]|uniref:response regulator n=1 Tax=Nitriliruptor alkaliphilus TaxID=427918 RepID=UPI000696CF77|nr:response regulator [Nitriliruptor alkaliphilus]
MEAASTSTPLDVLVIDDEPALSELVAANLAAAGHRVRTAPDGRAGLAAVAERRPDVVVLDVMMPVLDGWGVLEALAEDPSTAELPVVMLTALSSEQDVIRAHLTGAVHYLTKPFEVSALLTTVHTAATPPNDEQRRERRLQLRGFLSRLAELDAGRTATGPRVRFAGLESMPPADLAQPVPSTDALTPRQRHVAGLFADGVSARAIAEQLGTSRSNVYATRARIARHLGVAPEDVVETARRVGLTASTEHED